MRAAFGCGLALATLAFGLTAHAQDPPPDERRVTVTFETKDPAAQLIESTFVPPGPSSYGYVSSIAVCTGPCTTTVRRTSYFSIGGSGVTATPDFWLPRGEHVRVRANAGSDTGSTWGGVLTAAGVADAGIGAAFLGVHLLGRPITQQTDIRDASLWMLGSGVAILVIGVPLLLLNRTVVKTDVLREAQAKSTIRLTWRGLEF